MVRFSRSHPGVTLRSNNNGSHQRQWNSVMKYLILLVCMGSAFYAGVMSGMHVTSYNTIITGNTQVKCEEEEYYKMRTKSEEDMINSIVLERVTEALAKQQQQQHDSSSSSNNNKPLFGPTVSRFAYGMARVNKEDLLSQFDYGIPKSYSNQGSEEALLLYHSRNAVPNNVDATKTPLRLLPNVEDATHNCQKLHVIMTQSSPNVAQCTAIVSNYESFHVQRWMRISPEEEQQQQNGSSSKRQLDPSLPLVHVGRGMQTNGVNQFVPPQDATMVKHWKMLQQYLDTVDDTKQTLKPILKKIARKNTVVVMVTNFGQSTLLTNFVCSSRANNFDISNVLVFATDEDTLRLAQSLGLTAFYDEKNFASLPSQEANAYGDRTFVAMMYAKVVTVQLVNSLGYDLLFQDVDMVWYKDPLPYLRAYSEEFDMLFQDDGARSVRYAPYCANSGFYYVKYNARTRYLLTSLLYHGDLIMSTNSHQQALNALLVDHASLYGLKVKTLDGDDFPGGFHYHRRRDLMKSIVNKSFTPFIFHMSWTENKDNKLLFFKQMGMWHVKDQCVDKKAITLMDEKKETVEFNEACCSIEPLISCHYKDKPSVIPCNDSPSIDKNGKSFWPNE